MKRPPRLDPELDFNPEIPCVCNCHGNNPTIATLTVTLCCPLCGDRTGLALCTPCSVTYMQCMFSCRNGHTGPFHAASRTWARTNTTKK